ncbi:MAG: hypothetical protein ACI4SU_01595 [Anaerovoracaceae bacterium]
MFEMKKGEESVRFFPKDTAISSLTDALTGILKTNFEVDRMREEFLQEKYEIID